MALDLFMPDLALSAAAGSLRTNDQIFCAPSTVLNSFEIADYVDVRNTFAESFGNCMIHPVIIVSKCIVFSDVGWVSSYWLLILLKMFTTDVFFIFLVVRFMRRNSHEVALVEGVEHVLIFSPVVSVLGAATIFTFICVRGDFFSRLISRIVLGLRTAPLEPRSFVDAQGPTDWGAVFAMGVISLLPVFIVFLLGERFLIQGITIAGGK